MSAAPPPRRALFAQRLLGFFCWLLFHLPFLRGVRGFPLLRRGDRRLFLCNHVSLLDTLMLGGIFWARGRLPILVLGDRRVWQATRARRLLSARVGFLIERGRPSRALLEDLRAFGRAARDFHLIVFPEGTRGDGRTVGPCQPGVLVAARAARVPLVPVFLEGMQQLSGKGTGFHPLRGLRKVRVHFGEEIAPERYAHMGREEFARLVRARIQALCPGEEKTPPPEA